MPPHLGRQDNIISIESMQNCGMPPLVSWAEALSTQRVGEDVCFWPGTWNLNLRAFFSLFT